MGSGCRPHPHRRGCHPARALFSESSSAQMNRGPPRLGGAGEGSRTPAGVPPQPRTIRGRTALTPAESARRSWRPNPPIVANGISAGSAERVTPARRAFLGPGPVGRLRSSPRLTLVPRHRRPSGSVLSDESRCDSPGWGRRRRPRSFRPPYRQPPQRRLVSTSSIAAILVLACPPDPRIRASCGSGLCAAQQVSAWTCRPRRASRPRASSC